VQVKTEPRAARHRRDKGLCGALEHEPPHAQAADPRRSPSTVFVASGKKGASFLARTGRTMIADFALPDMPELPADQGDLAVLPREVPSPASVDSVSVPLSASSLTRSTQKPCVVPMLPISSEAAQGKGDQRRGRCPTISSSPTPTVFLTRCCRTTFHFSVFQMILDARASRAERPHGRDEERHRQREAASLKDLTLEYNKARQAGITTELLEITTAQMALA